MHTPRAFRVVLRSYQDFILTTILSDSIIAHILVDYDNKHQSFDCVWYTKQLRYTYLIDLTVNNVSNKI